MKASGIMKVDVIDNRRRIEWKRLNNKIGFGHSIGQDLQDNNSAPNSIFRPKVGGLAWRSVFFYFFSWNNHRIMISRQHRTLEGWMNDIAQFGDAGRVVGSCLRHLATVNAIWQTHNCRLNYLSIFQIKVPPEGLGGHVMAWSTNPKLRTWWIFLKINSSASGDDCEVVKNTKWTLYEKSGQTFVLEQSRAGHLIRTGCRLPGLNLENSC